MSFWCLQFPPKNERKQVDLKFHSSKVEFICLFFGWNVYLKKSFRLFLTFNKEQVMEELRVTFILSQLGEETHQTLILCVQLRCSFLAPWSRKEESHRRSSTELEFWAEKNRKKNRHGIPWSCYAIYKVNTEKLKFWIGFQLGRYY